MRKAEKTRGKGKEAKKTKKGSFKSIFVGERVISNSKQAVELLNKSYFGQLIDGKVHYSLVEAAYLLEKKKMQVFEGKKKLTFDKFIEKARKIEKNFLTRYYVFRDIRSRGYIVKTALKFGADFRVYDRGAKPGKDHAKWILFPVHQSEILTWFEFVSKNRVAHSTRKKLLIGIVDDEGDVTYYECEWIRP